MGRKVKHRMDILEGIEDNVLDHLRYIDSVWGYIDSLNG